MKSEIILYLQKVVIVLLIIERYHLRRQIKSLTRLVATETQNKKLHTDVMKQMLLQLEQQPQPAGNE